MRIALLTVASLGLMGNSAFAAEPENAIRDLGSRSFAEREAATKVLQELGPDSLPTLQKALAETSNPEVTQRLSSAIARIQRRADSQSMTQAKPIALDFKDRPLTAAVADFRTKTGIQLVLDPSVKDSARPITVKTEELPPWEALEKFCAAAGLKENLKADAKPEAKTRPTSGRRPIPRDIEYSGKGNPQAFGAPGDIPVMLVDGKSTSPSDGRSGVRIRALPISYPGSGIDPNTGELTIHFDVAPIPGLNWINTKEIRIGKATTASGRELSTIYRPDILPYQDQIYEGNLGIRLNDLEGDVPVLKPTRTNSRALPVAFKLDDPNLKSLRNLEGLIIGEVSRTNRPIITVEDLESAKGESFGYRMSTLTVLSMASDAKSGATTLKLRVSSSVYDQEMMLGGQMPGGFGGGLRPREAILDQRSFAAMKYYDAKGTLLKQPVVQSMNSTSDGVNNVYEATIRFGSGSDNIPPKPTKLVLIGTELVTVEVPFKLKDIPLE